MTEKSDVQDKPEDQQVEVQSEAKTDGEEIQEEAVQDETAGVEDTPELKEANGGADNEVEQLKAALAEAKAKADENWDRVLRMQADMENTRKRLRQETENARKFGQTSLIEELLPICDSMEMGLNAASEENAEIGKIREGYELTSKMLEQMLAKFNVEQINPLDQKFDPDKHQAMSMQEGTGKEPNTVVVVMQKGYTLNERLIRPALVMVAK